jgi:hypothetical protein
MHIDPALAAQLKADPDAYARFVGGLEGASIPVNYLHLITLISAAPGVPTMVLEVIPAAHGKATSFVTDAISVHVHEVDRDGGRVLGVCSDGDGTHVQKLGESYDVLADPGAYGMGLPLHRQEGVRQKITITGTDAGYCIDIHHQGKSRRYLIVDGQWLTVFQAGVLPCPEGPIPHLLLSAPASLPFALRYSPPSLTLVSSAPLLLCRFAPLLCSSARVRIIRLMSTWMCCESWACPPFVCGGT